MDSKKVQNHGHKPPMGIMYVGTFLRSQTSADVHLLDAQLKNLSIQQVIDRVQELNPIAVGITAWTDFWFDICQLIDGIKKALPDIHICLGGPHVSIYPRESLQKDGVDSIINGDGERPFAHLIKTLMGDTEGGFSGLYLKSQVGDPGQEFQPFVDEELNDIDIPDRTMLPYQEYDSVLANGSVTTMVTSRGCPFACTFCKVLSQKTGFRSAENVVKEMKIIADLGIKEVEIYDDTFGTDRQRVLDICRLLKESKVDLKFTIRDRVAHIDDEVLGKMKEVGLQRIYLGIETASDITLKTIKKGMTVEMGRKAVNLIKKHEIELLTYFMIGLPGENMEDAERTLELAIELKPSYANFSVTIPYPGTAMYDTALNSGIITEDIWKNFVENPTANWQLPVYTEKMSRKQLLSLHKKILHKFYFRKDFLFHQLKRLKNWNQFKKTAKTAYTLWAN